MAQSTDSFMPSYYGQMAYPYMGGTEWSSGSDSMPYVGYGAEAQQPNFLPDAVFGPQPGPTPVIFCSIIVVICPTTITILFI